MCSPPPLFRAPFYHIKRDIISNSYHVSICNICIIHVFNDLYHILTVRNLSVSEYNDVSLISLSHWFLFGLDIKQRLSNLRPSITWIEMLNLFKGLTDGLVIILLTVLIKPIEIWSKTDNIKVRVLRQRHDEQNQSLDCLFYSFTVNGAWSIQEENKLSWIILEVWFLRRTSLKRYRRTSLSCSAIKVARFLRNVSKLQVNFSCFQVIQFKG